MRQFQDDVLASTTRFSDEQLMQAYYDGDGDAFGELWLRHFSSLRVHAHQCLPNHFPGRHASSEDIASECLTKAMATKHRPSARWKPERGAVVGWLRAMVRNESVSLIRKQQREATLASDLGGSEDVAFDSMIPDHRETSMKAALDREQNCDLLWGMVSQLPEELAEIVTLKYRDRRKHREIAARLGCSPSTVSRRLENAERKLMDLGKAASVAG
jgi:RNA polymerase sigma factor (sigma-70 family)